MRSFDHGNWVRVDRALFRLPGWPTRDEGRYVLWRLWSHGLAVVSHQSALAVHDLGDVSPARLHLTVPLGFRAKHASVVIHRAILTPGDVEDRDGTRSRPYSEHCLMSPCPQTRHRN